MAKFVPVPPKIRTCGECKRKFASPDAFMKHKHKFGGCRSEEALISIGFVDTDKGWTHRKKVGKDGIRDTGL